MVFCCGAVTARQYSAMTLLVDNLFQYLVFSRLFVLRRGH